MGIFLFFSTKYAIKISSEPIERAPERYQKHLSWPNLAIVDARRAYENDKNFQHKFGQKYGQVIFFLEIDT